MRKTILVALGLLLTACSEHRVDTFPEWCEQISGVDLEEKYLPFWAVIFSVSFDHDAMDGAAHWRLVLRAIRGMVKPDGRRGFRPIQNAGKSANARQ